MRPNKIVSIVVASCLLLLSGNNLLAGTPFSGTLTNVTITDAVGLNTPPTAIFTYTKEGDIITFDASGSSDPDGTITQYKWNFGNGNDAEGQKTTITVTEETPPLQVTLSILDNSGGVALAQKTVNPLSGGINDDFSKDTSSQYLVLSSGDLSVFDGSIHTTPWKTTFAIHEKDLKSNNQSIMADVSYDGGNYGGGIIIRANQNQKTGYTICFESGRLMIKALSGASEQFIAQYLGDFAKGTYKLKAEINNNNLSIYVNNSLVVEKVVTNFSIGSFAGIKLRTSSDANSVFIDNFFATAL